MDLQTTIFGQKQHSGMQLMGETREPMSMDCWEDAQKLAEMYSGKLRHDFWVLYAAKPHKTIPNAIVAGWEVIAKRPPAPMLGVLVFKWSHKDRRLNVETDLSLPYDVPLSDIEMSTSSKDIVPTIGETAKRSGAILLA